MDSKTSRGHSEPSEAANSLQMPLEAVHGLQSPPIAFRRCPWPLEVTLSMANTSRGCPRALEALRELQRLSKISQAVHGLQRLSNTSRGCPRLLEDVHVLQKLSKTYRGCPWLYAVHGLQRLYIVSRGCSKPLHSVHGLQRLYMASPLDATHSSGAAYGFQRLSKTSQSLSRTSRGFPWPLEVAHDL